MIFLECVFYRRHASSISCGTITLYNYFGFFKFKMYSDIVIPQNNETEFAEVALKLGIKKLYFLYELNNFSEEKINKKIESIKEKYNLNFGTGIIVKNPDTSKIKINSKLIVAKSSDNDRMMIESKKINLIYGFEELGKKDFMHQRASGLNHIMCELAKRNNTTIGFSYSSLFNESSHALIIGRIRQNIKLCKKYKLKTAIGAFTENPLDMRSPYDIQSLFNILGMGGRNIKDYSSHH